MVTLSIDPHVHSEHSYDGNDPIELILEQAADIGLDGVVITDHNRIEASLEAARTAEEYGLIGIPGVEVSTAVGHVLAIGVTDCPEPRRSLEETVADIRSQGGAAVVAHPFQVMRHGIRKKHITDVDAIEVYNAWLFTGLRNRRARTFARSRDYPFMAGSDAHSVATVGRAYTELNFPDELSRTEIDAEMVVNAIKEGKTAVTGRRAPVHRSAGHYLLGAGKIICHRFDALVRAALRRAGVHDGT